MESLLPSHFWTVNEHYVWATLIRFIEPATYLNELLLQTARQYWYNAYGAARYPFGNNDKSGLALVIHDGFQPLNTFENYMTEPEYEDVLLDTHNYQVFNDEYVAWNWDEHISVSSYRAVNELGLHHTRTSVIRLALTAPLLYGLLWASGL